MRFKGIFWVFIFLQSLSGFAQKRMLNTLDSQAVKGVFIDSDQVFEVFVRAVEGSGFSVNAEVEGETFETLKLDTTVENGLWHIETGRTFGFKNIDDKLAAHKVLSVVLYIEMPQDKEVWVDSDLASVQLTGAFDQINLNLSGGGCMLNNFRGSGIVNTLRGSITAAVSDTRVLAESRNGIVNTQETSAGSHLLSLKTIDGDISVSQSE
ncbi:hypothetical protein [Leeuwenhoekiella sp. H156]|uniref:hypothetical protein n=1 Tax=Leeuwenhoekiella sp. H156 TaxID=3450128 RepID=UPI003FA418B5